MILNLIAAICVFGPGVVVVPLVVWRMVAARRETAAKVAALAWSRATIPSPRERAGR